MTVSRNLVCLALFLGATGAAPQAVAAQKPYSYAHAGWCAENRQKDMSATLMCADKAWCEAQAKNPDKRIGVACNMYRSKADKSLPSPVVTLQSLRSGRDLQKAERLSDCVWDLDNACPPSSMTQNKDAQGTDPYITPDRMSAFRFALRAEVNVWNFAPTIITIGVAPDGDTEMVVVANVNGNGPRETRRYRLSSYEIEKVLLALKQSNFWQLPKTPLHVDGTDGEVASIEVSVPGRKHWVRDAIGNSEAVDLSALMHVLGEIVGTHWKTIPGAELIVGPQ